MSIDILQEQHQWKLELKSIRDVVRQVEENVMHSARLIKTYIKICRRPNEKLVFLQ